MLRLTEKNSEKAITLVETVAVMSVMVPILMSAVFVIAEVSHFYVIKQGLVHASRQAARSMVAMYDESPMISSSRSLQNAMVYDKIRVDSIVNASSQFDSAVFNSKSLPPVVTVTVHYKGGQHGLMQFPLFDPLNIGASSIGASATYTLY